MLSPSYLVYLGVIRHYLQDALFPQKCLPPYKNVHSHFMYIYYDLQYGVYISHISIGNNKSRNYTQLRMMRIKWTYMYSYYLYLLGKILLIFEIKSMRKKDGVQTPYNPIVLFADFEKEF